MPISLVESPYVTDHEKIFIEKAIQKGFGRVPTETEMKARETANGNMDLAPDRDFMIMKYYAQVVLGVRSEYEHRVQGSFEVIAVSASFKQTMIEQHLGFEPTPEEIREKYPTGEVPMGYELVAIERDLIATLGDWQTLVANPAV